MAKADLLATLLARRAMLVATARAGRDTGDPGDLVTLLQRLGEVDDLVAQETARL